MAYETIGPYKQGVWLVAKGGHGAIVSPNHLPPEGTGFQYYWLGTSYQEAQVRLMDALSALDLHPGLQPPSTYSTAIQQAFGGGVGTVEATPGGIIGAIDAALQGGVFITGPVDAASGDPALGSGSGTAAAEGAGAGAGAKAATGGGAGGVLSKAVQNAPSLLKAASITALFTDIGTWKGIGLILAGAVMIILASRQLLT